MTAFEYRPFAQAVEVRSAPGGRLTIGGVVIRYGARSKDLGGFRERILAGAAAGAIASQDVLALEEHRSERYLGRTGNGTLRLLDSSTALRYEVEIPDTAVGREVAALAERGDYKGSSFGFSKRTDTWTKDTDGFPLRTVNGISRLRDVGPTVAPAYDDTTAQATYRSLLADQGVPVEVRNAIARAAGIEQRPRVIHRRPAHWFA